MKYNRDLPEDLYYLDENFSVRSLRKNQLKEILEIHNVPHPQNIKKLDMIELFKENIAGNRENILKEYRLEHAQDQPAVQEEFGRGHRVSHKPIKFQDEMMAHRNNNLVNASQSSETPLKDKDGFAVPAIPIRRSPPRFAAEDSFDEDSQSDAPQNESAQVAHAQHQLKSSLRKHVPTTFKEKPAEVKAKKSVRFTSPTFNAEDSFASSDDEQVVQRTRQRVPRKRSPPQSTNTEITPAAEEQPAEHQQNVASIEDEEEEDSDYLADSDETDDEYYDETLEDNLVDDSEVNTLYRELSLPVDNLLPSQQTMLTRAQRLAAAKQQALIWKAKFKNVGLVLCSIYMFIAVFGLIFTTYARQRNGYCESEKADKDVSFIFSVLPSSCIPCPSHGECVHGELVCDALYEQKRPWYNIGGILPIADECIHNSRVGKHVAQVEDKIRKRLATEQGRAVCEHLLAHPDSTPKDVPIRKISADGVLEDMKTSVEPHFPPELANEIMYMALAGVLEDPDTHFWEIDNERFMGTTHVRYSIGCQLMRLYINTPINVKLYALLFISALSAVYGASKDYQKHRQSKRKIDNLVKNTIASLRDQYENHAKDPKTFESPALPVSQIRSSILDVNDSKTLQDWQKVVEEVHHHPHIRKSFQEVRGDPVEYWELTP